MMLSCAKAAGAAKAAAPVTAFALGMKTRVGLSALSRLNVSSHGSTLSSSTVSAAPGGATSSTSPFAGPKCRARIGEGACAMRSEIGLAASCVRIRLPEDGKSFDAVAMAMPGLHTGLSATGLDSCQQGRLAGEACTKGGILEAGPPSNCGLSRGLDSWQGRFTGEALGGGIREGMAAGFTGPWLLAAQVGAVGAVLATTLELRCDSSITERNCCIRPVMAEAEAEHFKGSLSRYGIQCGPLASFSACRIQRS
mmetsp:Transcript_3818/g.6262  ORF Transcript_3818/g.6262 Transcript_3818/m.6262 type:complete len:253 (-) Transcript_3818:64-822(-)